MTRKPFVWVVAPSAAPSVTAWRIALPAITFALLATLAVYFSTGTSIVRTWARSATFAHGFVVVPIVLWLVWRARAQLTTIKPSPSWWLLGPLAAAGFCWLLGEVGSVNAVSQLALVAMLVLAVPVVLGTAVARNLAFPLGFLCFAIPIGEFMMPQLMEWTADFVVLGLEAAGIPVYREGLQFAIPSGTWSVVEACSGMRYLIASLMVGTLYAYLSYRSLKRRAVFIAFSVLVPVLANWIRAYAVVMIGHFSGNALARGVDHLIYGWLFFGVVMTFMLWVGARWREDDRAPQTQRVQSAAPCERAAAAQLWIAVAALAVVTGMWRIGYWAIERGDVAPRPELQSLGTFGGWHGMTGGLTDWRPHFINPSAEVHERFRYQDLRVGLYLGYYRNQSEGRELVSSENVLVRSDEPTWTRVASGSRPIDLVGERVIARTAELRARDGERLVLWQWNWINGRLTASDHWTKAYTAFARLLGQGDDSAVVIVYTLKNQPGGAEAALEAFLRDAASNISTALEHTRSSR